MEKTETPPKKEKELGPADASIRLWRVYQKTTFHYVILSWRVPSYEKLKCNKIYFQIYESLDVKCVLRMFKKEDSLYLCVSSSTVPKSTKGQFLITDEENLVVTKATAEEIGEGVFAAEFQNERFLGPDKQFLHHGRLTISFQYASDCYDTNTESNIEQPEVLTDLDDLCCDLKNMYLESLFPDFLIHVQDYSFKTHRFILAARSEYFDDLFGKDRNLESHTLDALPGIAHEVFLYMYSGELQEMNLECMMRVFELASLLKMSSLCLRCIEIFKQKMNMDNFLDLLKFSHKNGFTALKNSVAHFMHEHLPEFMHINIYKEAGIIGAKSKT